MALGKPPLVVPLLSPYIIKVAELSAIELWNGVDFETGKKIDASDEELLKIFYMPVLNMWGNARARNQIVEDDVRLLIKLGKLKALFRSHLPLDFVKGIGAIKKYTMPIYRTWRTGKLQLTPSEYATKMILDLGASFVQTSKLPTRNGNYRVPLASRILFYAVPDMLIFSYSNGLGKVLNLQSRPQSAIPYFNERMHKGLQRNALLLNKLDMPSPNHLSKDVWRRIKLMGWWQRRVLDLALLIHYNLAAPNHDLQVKARLAIRKQRIK